MMPSLIQIKDAAANSSFACNTLRKLFQRHKSSFRCKMRTLLGFLPHPGASACVYGGQFINGRGKLLGGSAT